MKRFRVLNGMLLVLIALAAWRTVEVWRRRPPERELPPDVASRAGGDALPPAPRRPSLEQVVQAIADKDLFDASRKAPEVSSAGPAPTPAPPPPTLKLSGVVLVGSQREALLIDTAQANKQLRMRVGEEVSGYKVGRIESEQVSLVGSSGEEVVLQLQIEKAKATVKRAYGPGGKPVAQPVPGGAAGGALRPPPGPAPGAPQPEVARTAAGASPDAGDARQRAEAARERLKRLRAEAGSGGTRPR